MSDASDIQLNTGGRSSTVNSKKPAVLERAQSKPVEDWVEAELEGRLTEIRATLKNENTNVSLLSAIASASAKGWNDEEDEIGVDNQSYEYVMTFKMVSEDGRKLRRGETSGMIPNYACSIIKALLEARMEVYTYLSAQKDELICLVTASDPVLNEFADDKNYFVPLDPAVIQMKMEMGSRKNRWKGRVIDDSEKNFSRWSPYRYIYGKWESELDDVTIYNGLARTGPAVKDIVMFKRGSLDRFKLIAMMIKADPQLQKGAGVPVETLLNKHHIDAFYPMHQPGRVKKLLDLCLLPKTAPWQQPMEMLRTYFGEKVGLYYAFMGHYSAWLVLPAIVGFVFQLVAWGSSNLSHPVIPCFAAFICVWAVLMIQFWNRQQSLTAFMWGMSEFESREMQRPEYQGRLIKSFVDGRYMLYYPVDRVRAKLAASTSVIVTLILMVIGAVAGIYVMKYTLSKTIGSASSTVASIINTIQITIFNMLYTAVARWLVNNENHKTESQYQDSLITKIFVFQFVNSYASFFFIAFVAANLAAEAGTDPTYLGQCGWVNCMQPLSINLAIIFGSRLTISNLLDVGLKVYAHKEKVKRETEGLSEEQILNLSPPERDYALQEFDATMDSIEIYSDVAIQYGFSVLFICALPIACACSLVSNHVKVKIQAWKLLTMYQRPVPAGAQDIGSWQSIFTIISVLAVLTNAGLVCFTMDVLWKDSNVNGSQTFSGGVSRAGFTLVGRMCVPSLCPLPPLPSLPPLPPLPPLRPQPHLLPLPLFLFHQVDFRWLYRRPDSAAVLRRRRHPRRERRGASAKAQTGAHPLQGHRQHRRRRFRRRGDRAAHR